MNHDIELNDDHHDTILDLATNNTHDEIEQLLGMALIDAADDHSKHSERHRVVRATLLRHALVIRRLLDKGVIGPVTE